jgi:hypothetical protein
MIGLAQVAMEGHDPGHHFPLSHVHKRVVLLSGHYTGSNDRNFCSLITGRPRRYYTHPTEGCSDLRVRDCRLLLLHRIRRLGRISRAVRPAIQGSPYATSKQFPFVSRRHCRTNSTRILNVVRPRRF